MWQLFGVNYIKVVEDRSTLSGTKNVVQESIFSSIWLICRGFWERICYRGQQAI